MKRFHVHVSVDDLGQSIRFYSNLFGAEPGTTCCYAKSDEYWVTDPQDVAWETFHTLSAAATFSAPNPATPSTATACCAPKAAPVTTQAGSAGSCCG